MRKTKPRYYVRKFINKPGNHTVASVLASIGRGGDITFILSDCDRTVKLDFTAYRTDMRSNALYKAQTLIDILTEFKAAMELSFKEAKETGRDDDF